MSTIRGYRDVELIADTPAWDGDHLRGLTVRLHASPAGSHAPVRQDLPAGLGEQLRERLGSLEARTLDQAGIIGLGSALADLLMPTGIRELVARSIDALKQGDGLRIRLRLDPALADLPWEFVWVARQAGQVDATGFLALDPRLSIVRDETVAGTVDSDGEVRDRRMVAALANPVVPGTPPLSLDAELLNLQTALAAVRGLSLDVVKDPDIEKLNDALLDGADVFHFSGHGVDDNLALVGEQRRPSRLPAEQLAMNLRARGVQLAVLGACESGGRSRQERWSGVATRLIAEGIPAVVAMQYRINDRTAIAFSKALYKALSTGWSIDEAVATARLAIYNETTGGDLPPSRAKLWRDWGVPVLYLRPDAAISLASVAEPEEREQVTSDLAIRARARVRDVTSGGQVTVVDAGTIRAGSIDAVFEGRNVDGNVTVVSADNVSGGAIDARADVEGDVGEGGNLVGVRVDSIGGRRRRRRGDDG